MSTKKSSHLINLCFIPFICVLPAFGMLSCSSDQATETASYALNATGDALAQLPENVQTAAPYLQEDLEKLWYSVCGSVEVYAEDVGVSEPPHQLTIAEEAREKLISGSSFDEVVASAMNQITPEDLQSVPVEELQALNGILPFEVDLSQCGETLAEVLNSLDVGQVSAVLRSEYGYHLIQVIDREGGRLRLGHLVFEVSPPPEEAVAQPPDQVAQQTDPLGDAISRLADAVDDQ